MLKSPFDPCIPSGAKSVPDSPAWIHEIKHDGYRLIVQRDGKRVRLWTRNGHDWRGGRSNRWIKVKNRQHPAFSRVQDQFG
jgi:ATP-dependent DNA ligase